MEYSVTMLGKSSVTIRLGVNVISRDDRTQVVLVCVIMSAL
jgi:hypothetical protein